MDPNNPRDEENEQPENNDGDLLPQIRGGEPKLKLRDTGVMPRKASRPRKAPRRPDHAQLRKEARSKILMPGWSTDTVRQEQVDNDGCNVLHIITKGDYGMKVAKKLLERKFDPNIQDFEGITPIHISLGDWLEQYATLMMKYEGRLDVPDKYGQTAPFYMPRMDDVNEFKLDYTTINAVDREGFNLFQFLLEKATYFETKSIMDYINAGAEYRNVNYINENCLHTIADNEDFEEGNDVERVMRSITRKLIRKGGLDLNLRNHKLQTPLHRAIWNFPSLIQELLRAGADVNIVDKFNKTPIDVALTALDDQASEAFIKNFIFRKHRRLSVNQRHIDLLYSECRLVQYFKKYVLYMTHLKKKKLIPFHKTCRISFYDLLCSSRKKLQEIVRNPRIKEYFTYSYRKRCHYAKEIHEQWREAVTTVNLQDRCIAILEEILHTIPFFIVKNIVQFLPPPEMRNLIYLHDPNAKDGSDTDVSETDEEETDEDGPDENGSDDDVSDASGTDQNGTEESETEDDGADEGNDRSGTDEDESDNEENLNSGTEDERMDHAEIDEREVSDGRIDDERMDVDGTDDNGSEEVIENDEMVEEESSDERMEDDGAD